METSWRQRAIAAPNPIDTPAKRRKLAPRKAPYSVRLGKGLALLYWRGKSPVGTWKARLPGIGDRAIGPADDVEGTPGALTFQSAAAEVLRLAREGLPLADDTPAPPAALTVDDALDAYVRHATATKSAHSVRTIQSHVSLIPPAILKRPCAEIALHEWNAWRDGCVTPARKPSTVNKAVATVKAALGMAGVDGPWRGLRKFKAADGTRDVAFSADEVRSLVAAAYAYGEPFGCLIDLAARTGARYGELIGARVRDVGRATLYVAAGKTGPRTVPLSPDTAALVRALAADRDPAAPLLLQRDGKPWTDGSARYPLAKAIEAAGLDKRPTFYSLRHTYITLALYNGVPVNVVAKVCGTSIDMIDKTYSKVLADLEAFALERMDDVLSAPLVREAAE